MIIYSRWNCEHATLEHVLREVREIENEELWTRDQWRLPGYQNKMYSYRFYGPWLKNRIELFKTFTYPSVLSQTDQDFKWFGLVHKESPKWFIEELKRFDRMEIKLVKYDTEEAIKGEDSINLDTDDAISRDFIQIAKGIRFEGETVFNYGLKYRAYTNNWLYHTYDDAHFNLIRHPEITVLDYLHGRADLPKNIVKTKFPMWIQVIHERNIANCMHVPRSKANPPIVLTEEVAKKRFDIDYNNLGKNLILP